MKPVETRRHSKKKKTSEIVILHKNEYVKRLFQEKREKFGGGWATVEVVFTFELASPISTFSCSLSFSV